MIGIVGTLGTVTVGALGTVSDGTVTEGTDGTLIDGTVIDGTVTDGTVTSGTLTDGSVSALLARGCTPSATSTPAARAATARNRRAARVGRAAVRAPCRVDDSGRTPLSASWGAFRPSEWKIAVRTTYLPVHSHIFTRPGWPPGQGNSFRKDPA